MSRWEPDARGRLTEAAMELYRERGFDETTVADIAARAGLTERTFFRYFADKREVLFSGSKVLQDSIVDHIARAADLKVPLDLVGGALEAVAPSFDERRDFARRRHALIAAHADLQERELIKLAALAAAVADALHRRGIPEPAASLTADAGIAVFKNAFSGWVHDTKRRTLAQHIRKSLDELRAVAGGKVITASRAPRLRAEPRRR
jgi:AcrR family transcriptional regulator